MVPDGAHSKAAVTQPNKRRTTPPWLKALGRHDLPDRVFIAGRPYLRVQTLKHDFFAATGLYAPADGDGPRMTYKVGRRARLFGVPLAWLGRGLTNREARLYAAFADLAGVPDFAGRIGRDAFAHVYVEGRPLKKGDAVNDAFFPALQSLMEQVHARRAAYVDFEKRENIIVGDDDRPYLIDFQISWQSPPDWRGRLWPMRWLLRKLQASDRYHLLKHWRRFRPDQLDAEMMAVAQHVPSYIKLHRTLTRPLMNLRRQALARLDPARANYKRQ
jgi:hypothetical protein